MVNYWERTISTKQVYGETSVFKNARSIGFKDVNSSNPFCPLALQKLQLYALGLSYLNEKSNFSFIDMSFTDQANISKFIIVDSNISLSSSLISKSMIKSVSKIKFDNSDIVSVSKDIFEEMNYLKHVSLDFMDFNKLMSKNTIKTMLKNVNKNLSMNSTIDYAILGQEMFALEIKDEWLNLTDDKICIYKEFPFDRYIVPFLFGLVKDKCNCAYRFLNMFGPLFQGYAEKLSRFGGVKQSDCLLKDNFYDELLKCDIDKRIAECYKKENKTAPAGSDQKYTNLIKSIISTPSKKNSFKVPITLGEDY